MPYSLMTDDEILADLAERFDLLRRRKEIRDRDLVKAGGTNDIAATKFRGGGNITLKTFVRLLRGLGELERLEKLLELAEPYAPSGEPPKITERRVRRKKKPAKDFRWGDEL